MIKRILVLLLCLGVILPLTAAEQKQNFGKIDFIAGNVRVELASGKKMEAKLNMKIFEGDKVRTAKNSSAQVILGKDIKIRIAANSEFELKKDQMKGAGKRETILGLNLGKIWTSVAKLKKDQKFTIETPTAVAGVRGTILVVKQSEEGTTLYVGKGLVNFLSKILNQEVDVGNGFMLTLGTDGKLSDMKKMTEQDMKDMMSGIPVFFTGGDQGLKDELKSEIFNEKNNLDKQQELVGKLKSDDLTAGRTLRDIHGNIVRVEQIFRKKDAASFQILNLSKRADGISYFDFTAVFNKPLPPDFKNWAEFFENSDVGMDKRDIVFGNKTAAGEDVFEWHGTYDPTKDDFKDTYKVNGKEMEYDGDINNTSFEDQVEFEANPSQLSSTGVLKLKETAQPLVKHSVRISIYVIDNEGNTLSEKYFTASENILNIFNTVAGEIILQSADFINGTIDVVTIPDIGFVMIQEIM